MKKDRVVYFDYLRFFAIIAVIILHVASQEWEGLDGRGFVWNVFNAYDSIVRWGVSVFIMISGSLFLSRDIDTKKIYTKYIPRMLVSYFVWSAIYAVFAPDRFLAIDSLGELTFGTVVIRTIEGAFHLWFIPMIIGLYMCIPVLRQLTKNSEVTKYYLILSLVFAFAVPEVLNLVRDFFPDRLAADIAKAGANMLSDMGLKLVLNFVPLFILGYVLSKEDLSLKTRKTIYVLGAVGLISTILLNAIFAWKTGKPFSRYYDTFTLNVLSEAVSVFVWFKYKDYKNEKLNTVISALSKYSFGAYLVHILVMAVFNEFGLNAFSFNPILSVPLLSLTTIIVSFAVSYVLNKIPVINRWIV